MANLRLSKKMREQRCRYVDEFFIDYNQSAAAIRAGYSPRSAASIASELMKDPDVQEMIEYKKSFFSARIGTSVERIQNELACLAHANARNFIEIKDGNVQYKDMEDISEFDSAAIQEIVITKSRNGVTTTKLKLADKKGPLELLGKIHKMFVDRIEIKDTTDRAQSMKKARERVRNGQAREPDNT